MASADSRPLTCELLRATFDYDADTGLFTRKACADLSHVGDVPGTLDGWGYVRFRALGRKYRAHRLAWLYVFGEWPLAQIDHLDGAKTNNRLGNLRDASQSWNQQNRTRPRMDSKLQVIGVASRQGRFIPEISLDGKTRYLGSFATLDEAKAAHLAAKAEYHPGHLKP